jgi:hypothetical protein
MIMTTAIPFGAIPYLVDISFEKSGVALSFLHWRCYPVSRFRITTKFVSWFAVCFSNKTLLYFSVEYFVHSPSKPWFCLCYLFIFCTSTEWYNNMASLLHNNIHTNGKTCKSADRG